MNGEKCDHSLILRAISITQVRRLRVSNMNANAFSRAIAYGLRRLINLTELAGHSQSDGFGEVDDARIG
jgi:hypothetical protein